MPLPLFHAPIPRTCECDTTSVIMFCGTADLNIGRLSQWASSNHTNLKTEEEGRET